MAAAQTKGHEEDKDTGMHGKKKEKKNKKKRKGSKAQKQESKKEISYFEVVNNSP